ncbi:MAG: response regulator transcription factor [Dehalococcoidia bacterium]
MAERIRVLIVDDHAIVRQGLKAFLRTQDDVEVVGEAADGEEALRQTAALAPDVVLMDLVMPKRDGVEATKSILALRPDAKVIVLTSFTDDERVIAAVRAGAAGYLLKDVAPSELSDGIRAVFSGQGLLHPSVAGKVMREVAAGRRAPHDSLTERERDVLQRLARGMSNKEIGRELGVAEKTVKTHVSSILQKLDLADRTQAALYAVRERLVDPS